MSRTAFIIVDVQGDFIDGSLAVPDADQIILPLKAKMYEADVIVLTQDWHPENHFSFQDDPDYVDGSWPPHCVQHTPGAEVNLEVLNEALATQKPVLIVHKGVDPSKEAYSGFDGRVVENYHTDDDFKGLDLEKAFFKLNVERVFIGGLAMDYCVAHTAMDSWDAGYDTYVVQKATRAVNPDTEWAAIQNLEETGIKLV